MLNESPCPNRSRILKFSGLAAALMLAVYGRALPYSYVYDDVLTIVRNPSLEHLFPIGRFFTDARTVVNSSSSMATHMYRPLSTLSFAVDFQLWNLNPMALRAENLLLHFAGGVLLFAFLLVRAEMSPAAAAIGGLVFLFHPGQVESVVWITQRSNLMCFVTLLGALWFLTGPTLNKKKIAAGLSLFSLALLSKETAIVFIALLACWDVKDAGRWKETLFSPRRKKIYFSLILISLAYLVLRHQATGQVSQRELRAGGLAANWMIAGLAWLEYWKMILWPVHLTVSHQQYVPNPWQSPWPLAGLVWLGAVTGLIVIFWKRSRGDKRAGLVSFGLAWILLTLLPILGFIPIDNFVTERFLYIPLAGAGLLAGVLWQMMDKDPLRGIRKGVFGLGLGLLVIISCDQVGVWQNEWSLWQAAVLQEPSNAFAHVALAQTYFNYGKKDRAADEYKTALSLNPPRGLAQIAVNGLAQIAQDSGPAALPGPDQHAGR